MNHHLSHDRISQCIAGQTSSEERHHIAECPKCRSQVDRFAGTMATFRSILGDRIRDRIACAPAEVRVAPATHPSRFPVWRWAAVAMSIIVLGLLPHLGGREEPPPSVISTASAPATPDAFMNAINLHLARTVPAPMERMMIVVVDDDSIPESGEAQ